MIYQINGTSSHNYYSTIITSPFSISFQGQSDDVNRDFVSRIQTDGRIYLIGSSSREDGFFLRLCVFNERTNIKNIQYAVTVLKEVATKLLLEKEK